MQEQIQNNVQIQHTAETHHMGELLAVYPRIYKMYSLWITILIVLCIGLIGLFPIGLIEIFNPLISLPWTDFSLILAISGIVIYPLLRWTNSAHRNDQIAIYTEGFIFLNGNTIVAYPWENITQIKRGQIQSTSTNSVNIDIDTITVTTIKNKFKLDPTWEKHARAAICDKIERSFAFARLPQVIAQYEAGEEIPFEISFKDFLRISKSGIRDATDLLPWPMVEKAEVDSTLVIIRKEGRTSDWCHKQTYTVPNAALLKALFDYIQSSRYA